MPRDRVRRIVFRLHWLLGLTAGIALVLMALTGATLAFRAEIIGTLNPPLPRPATHPQADPLPPATIAEQAARLSPGQRVSSMTFSAEPGQPVHVVFAPRPGVQRGERILLDPWRAELVRPPRGEEFFAFVERLHRWFLLPKSIGKQITGPLAIALLVMALSGLYLRWPRRPAHWFTWRAWLRIDRHLRGRPFLLNLHRVAGTIALPVYLMSALTGIYWSFDALREWVDDSLAPPRPHQAAPLRPPGAASGLDLQRAWASFRKASGDDWSKVTMRLPSPGMRASRIDFSYLHRNPVHEEARNRLSVDAASGAVIEHSRHADLAPGTRAIASARPLHMGSYWGWPGRIMTATCAALLPLFALTGWMMHRRRRTQAR